MYFNMKESTGLVNPDINVVFDESIYAVDTDKEFVFEGSNLFNSEITFPSYTEAIRVIGQRYNRPLNFPPNVKNISNLFSGCPNYNQPTTLPNTVTNCVNALSGGKFNAPVVISNGITAIDSLFFAPSSSSSIFNQPLNIPDSVISMADLFHNCSNLNSPVNIGNNVTNMFQAFYYCQNFNQPVNIPDSVTNCVGLFSSCPKFNSQVNLGNGIVNASSMFSASGYNQPTVLPSGLKNTYQMFYYATNFNSAITFNGQESLQAMFQTCNNFNQPITVPNECVIMTSMFASARNFNSSITFGQTGNLIELKSTFSNAIMFNQPLNIPSGVINCQTMLEGVTEYNSIVIIPETVQNTYGMFMNVNARPYNFQNSQFAPVDNKALRQPIYFFCNSLVNSWNMFNYCNSLADVYIAGLQNDNQLKYFMRNNGSLRCNIYTDDVCQNYIYNTTQFLINGGKPTWTNDATNGCIYNTVVNLYIYNNWDGTVPTI